MLMLIFDRVVQQRMMEIYIWSIFLSKKCHSCLETVPHQTRHDGPQASAVVKMHELDTDIALQLQLDLNVAKRSATTKQ